jgi:hypothetical protein
MTYDTNTLLHRYGELAFEIRRQRRALIHSDALAARLGRT